MGRFVFALALSLAGCSSLAEREGEAERPSSAAECTAADTWSWKKLGVVRGLPEAPAAGDGIMSPAVVLRDGVLHLWYATKTGARYALTHATSTDGGESFADLAPVTGLGEHLNAYPSAALVGERFELVFGSGSLATATSDDGVAFTITQPAVLTASFDDTRFDALSVLYPSRVDDLLFFAGFDGHHVRIGRATRNADGTFAVDPPRPVVDLGGPADFDNSATAQPHVQRAFGRWWMWYGGYDTAYTNPGPYRIGVASSTDGVAFTKHGVALDLGEHGSDAWSTRDPALLPSDAADHWTMFYVGMGDDGRYRLHRAVTDVSATCTRLPERTDRSSRR